MKGVIAVCAKKMVVENHGSETWGDILEGAGLPRDFRILPIDDVDDGAVMKVIESACKVLNITPTEFADAFGDYWVNVYAKRLYPKYYEGIKSAKELLLKMDDVHNEATATIDNAHPPHFTYKENDDGSLLMTYHSKRNLFPVFVGLVKGVAKHFNEEVNIEDMDNNTLKIVFKD